MEGHNPSPASSPLCLVTATLPEPSPLKATALRIEHGLGRVEITAIINNTLGQGGKSAISIICNEGDGVMQASLISFLMKPDIIVNRHYKHRLVAQRKEVWAFPHGTSPYWLAAVSVAGIEGIHIFPFKKIRRSKEQNRTSDSFDSSSDQLIPGSSFFPHRMVAKGK